MITKKEMLQDINMMLLVISAFSKPNTDGENLLNQWREKYQRK